MVIAQDPEVVAVLLALAGVRTGDAVAQCGAGSRVERGLLAMSGTAGLRRTGARVAVAGGPEAVPAAVASLGRGGRVVALAADEDQARACAAAAGVGLVHVVALPGAGVAWSGRLTASSPEPG